MNTDNIHAWLKELGHKIAEHAEPLKGMGGDHDYDGVINVVWQGIHEALGLKTHSCDLWTNTGKCQLAQHGHGITYTGETQTGGPIPEQTPSEAFVDGYHWAKIIDETYDLNAMTNLTQAAILDLAIRRANDDPEFMQAILKEYREIEDE
jgi:hypothetical protein